MNTLRRPPPTLSTLSVFAQRMVHRVVVGKMQCNEARTPFLTRLRDAILDEHSPAEFLGRRNDHLKELRGNPLLLIIFWNSDLSFVKVQLNWASIIGEQKCAYLLRLSSVLNTDLIASTVGSSGTSLLDMESAQMCAEGQV